MMRLALAFAVASGALQWGPVSSAVRLGIGAGPAAPEPMLRLVFENVGAPAVRIPLGGTTSQGPIYDMIFRVTSPQGKEFPLYNLNGPSGRLQTEPLVASLARGGQYEVLLPMRKFVCLEAGKSSTLPELLAEHYSVRALLDTTGNPREVRSFAIWAGSLSSGEYRR